MDSDKLTETLRLHREWVKGTKGGVRAYLSRADLRGADLSGADLSGADLRGADLRGADLWGADLSRADLRGAVLWRADLSRADLSGADLRGADLSRADLSGADLSGADLSGADLSRAVGNMCEIKSAQFDTWPIVWTCDPRGVTTLQIGCQRHELALWRKSDPRWIAPMHPKATDWWAKYGAIVLALVDASPATPWGKPAETATN